MRRAIVLCGLLAAAPARAADPALVAGIEKHLGDEEKALLAAVLIEPRSSAEFDADAREALSDPKTLKLVLDKWRGRFEAFAQADSQRADPNLEGVYRNYAEMLSPQIRAYLARRVPLMPEDARNDLIGYLKDINKSLADDGRLSWYSKKVVAGVMDRYRLQLKAYAATPLAQDGKRNAPAAALALAQQREQQRERLASAKPEPPPPSTPSEKPASKPAPKPPTQVATGPRRGVVAPADPASGARGQAGNAARDGKAPGKTPEEIAGNAGRAFDGGTVVPGASDGGTVVAGPGDDAKRPVLAPASPSARPSLVGSVPPVPATPEEDFMASLEGQQTKERSSPFVKLLSVGLGALVLGAAGFLVGGPIVAAAGLALGAAVGRLIGGFLTR